MQGIPPTTANKETQAQKSRGGRTRKLLGVNAKSYRLKLKLNNNYNNYNIIIPWWPVAKFVESLEPIPRQSSGVYTTTPPEQRAAAPFGAGGPACGGCPGAWS